MGANNKSIDPKPGEVFGYLTVICEVSPKVRTDGCMTRLLKCLCKCGKETITYLNTIRRRPNANCGCRRHEKGIHSVTHGLSSHSLYKRYLSMIARCYKEKSHAYKDYGGRGIIVCEEWLNDFMCFYNWAIKNGWEKHLDLDRINNDGDYEPDNCRWATKKKNCNNRRSSVKFVFNGEQLTLTEISRIVNIDWGTLYRRVKYYGMSLDEAVKSIDYRSSGNARNPRYNAKVK